MIMTRTNDKQKIEVVSATEQRRRRWSVTEKAALVNRTCSLMSMPAVNHKRFYRVMESASPAAAESAETTCKEPSP